MELTITSLSTTSNLNPGSIVQVSLNQSMYSGGDMPIDSWMIPDVLLTPIQPAKGGNLAGEKAVGNQGAPKECETKLVTLGSTPQLY